MRKSRKSKSSKYKNAYYNYNSEAYKYFPDYENKNVPLRRKQRRTVKKTESPRKNYLKSKKVSRYKIASITNYSHSFKVFFAIFFTFVLSLGLICTYALNTQKRDRINKLNTELKQIIENNDYLQTELAKNLDLSTVEKIATTRLGMQKPDTHQIVYINVPKQSYTMQYDTTTENNESKLDIKKIFSNLFRW